MSNTTIEQVLEHEVDERMDDRAWADLLHDVRRKLRNGFWSDAYLDMWFQKHQRAGDLSWVDIYCFSELHTALWTGKIVHAQICVGKTPGSDTEDEYHNAVLGSLRPPFYGHFSGGPGSGCDGHFGWHDPLEMGQVIDDGSGGEKPLIVTVSPGKLPLEVGYTMPSTTLGHFMGGFGVARWPYESEIIYALYRNDPDWLIPQLDRPAGLKMWKTRRPRIALTSN